MLKFSKRIMLIAFLVSAGLTSCEKKAEVPSEKQDPKSSIQGYDKLVKYLSVGQGVSIDEIKFDSEKQEFYIIGIPYRFKLDKVQELYNMSNEYKINYESK